MKLSVRLLTAAQTEHVQEHGPYLLRSLKAWATTTQRVYTPAIPIEGFFDTNLGHKWPASSKSTM